MNGLEGYLSHDARCADALERIAIALERLTDTKSTTNQPCMHTALDADGCERACRRPTRHDGPHIFLF